MTDRFREFISFAVQFAILMGCLILGFEAWVENRFEAASRTLLAEQRERTIQLAIATDPELYFREKIAAAARACRKGIPLDRLRTILWEKWGLDVVLFRFRPDCSLDQFAPANAQNRRLMEQVYRGLVATEGAEIDRLTRTLNNRIPLLFGYGKDLGTIRNQEGLPVEVFSQNERGMILYRSPNPGGLLFHLRRIPTPGEVFQRVVQLKRTDHRLPVFCGWGQRNEDQFCDVNGVRVPEAEVAFKRLPDSVERTGIIEGKRWIFLEALTGRRVFAAFPVSEDGEGSPRGLIRRGGAVFFLVGLLVLALGGNTALFRLRRLLLGLFLAAASIPLAGIILGSIDVVDVYRMVRGSRLRTVEEGTLRNLVTGFDAHLRHLSEKLRAETDNPGLSSGTDAGLRVIRRIIDLGLADRITCRNAGGKILLQWPPGPAARNETVLQGMARYAVERYAPERRNEASGSADPLGDAVVRNDDMGFATILNHPGDLQILQFGKKKILDFFRVFPAGTGPVACFQAQIDLRTTFRSYLLAQSRQRSGFEGDWLRLLAFDSASMQWILPPPRKHAPRLRQAALAALIFGRPEPLDLNPGSAVSLGTSLVSDLALISFSSGHLTESKIEEIWRMIGLGGILFLGLIGLLARGLSVQLLAPLRNLEDGVQALARRDFEFQLPPGRGDELGRLFDTFNLMMEGARDFELARHVQEGLIPQEFPQTPGYQIHGRLITASDLGGDLIDAFPLPDGRVCFYVGDVAGHGVGAALMMAFARAVVFHRSSREDFSLIHLAGDLDHLLRRRQEAETFLGLVCGLLEPATGKVELISAGMPFPLIRRAAGQIEWIGTPTLPLGSGTKPVQPALNSIVLDPGDLLLFYSDGYVESFAADGKMIGYNRLGIWVESYGSQTAPGLINELLDLHQTHRRGTVGDDVTLLIVRRNGAEEATP